MIAGAAMAAIFQIAAMVSGAQPEETGAPADVCPTPPEDAKARRALAKEWFTRGQNHEKGGDHYTAVNAFSCSLRMVPHPFTAFNMAKAAEQTGDLELSVESYRRYLELAPAADDRAEIEEKIAGFEAKLVKLREHIASRRRDDAAGDGGDPAGATNTVTAGDASRSAAARGPRFRKAAWSALAGGGATMAAGAIVNVLARGKMDDCRSLWADKRAEESDAACDSARTFAYTSYALLSIGAAAAAAGGALFYLGRATTVEIVTATWSPDRGAAVGLAGRF